MITLRVFWGKTNSNDDKDRGELEAEDYMAEHGVTSETLSGMLTGIFAGNFHQLVGISAVKQLIFWVVTAQVHSEC